MVDVASVILYLSLFVLSAGLVFVGEKYQRRVVTALGILVPIVCAAVRFNVGIDYSNYVEIANDLSSISLPQFLDSAFSIIYEHSLYYIVQFAMLFPVWQIAFFGFYSAITILPFYFAMRKISPKYTWLAVLFYLLAFFAPSLNGMRQFAAISIAFWATINYLYSSKATLAKIFYFVLVVLVASFLHSSAILTLAILPCVWLSKSLAKRPAARIIFYSVLIMLVTIVAEFIIIKYINQIPIINRYAHYLTWPTEDMPMPNLIPRLVPVLAGMWALTKKDLHSRNLICYYVLVCLSLVLTFLGFLIPYGYRMSDYFMIFQIPLFIEIVARTKRKDQIKIYLMIILAYALVYFLYSSVLNNSHGIFPYQFLFL